MDYTFVREGIPETVTLERWGWGVVYRDGGELKQFGDDGIFHQFKEIEQERVEMMVMYRTDDPAKRIDMPVAEGTQLFHFYRNIVLNFGEGENERRIRVYVFGWKKDGVAAYNYILPDDRFVVSSEDIRVLKHDI